MLPKRPLGALSYSSRHTPVEGSFSRMCSSAPRSLWRGREYEHSVNGLESQWESPAGAAHLILQEHVVSHVDDLLHVDDRANAGDVHLGQHGEHQDGLHQQLPVLGLGDTVQNRLHVDGELDLSRRHLRRRIRGRSYDFQPSLPFLDDVSVVSLPLWWLRKEGRTLLWTNRDTEGQNGHK